MDGPAHQSTGSSRCVRRLRLRRLGCPHSCPPSSRRRRGFGSGIPVFICMSLPPRQPTPHLVDETEAPGVAANAHCKLNITAVDECCHSNLTHQPCRPGTTSRGLLRHPELDRSYWRRCVNRRRWTSPVRVSRSNCSITPPPEHAARPPGLADRDVRPRVAHHAGRTGFAEPECAAAPGRRGTAQDIGGKTM